MILTTKGRYAVMAMVGLASDSSDKPLALSKVAEGQGINLPYLEQIFAKLKTHGLLNSIRGPGGGYLLARKSDKITIADIILAVDEPIKITRCSHDRSEGCMPGTVGRCITHDFWDGLSDHIYNYLESTTLADICDRKLSGNFAINLQSEGGNSHA